MEEKARTEPERWKIEVSSEVAAWYVGLGARQRAHADRAFDRLAAVGPRLSMPHARSLGEGLHELRFSCGGTARRVTYALGEGRSIRALTTFPKGRAVERHEVERARGALERSRTLQQSIGRSR